jgi:hypothetical protein
MWIPSAWTKACHRSVTDSPDKSGTQGDRGDQSQDKSEDAAGVPVVH